MTISCGLFVRLEARPGKEQAVADFLAAGLKLTNREATTPIWFVLQLSPKTFGVFGGFARGEDRRAHLAGDIIKALMFRVDELLAKPPLIEEVDVLAMKNPLA
jgi:quinol monooxygenase YgiN